MEQGHWLKQQSQVGESLGSPEHHKKAEGLAHGGLMPRTGEKSFLYCPRQILARPLNKEGDEVEPG